MDRPPVHYLGTILAGIGDPAVGKSLLIGGLRNEPVLGGSGCSGYVRDHFSTS